MSFRGGGEHPAPPFNLLSVAGVCVVQQQAAEARGQPLLPSAVSTEEITSVTFMKGTATRVASTPPR